MENVEFYIQNVTFETVDRRNFATLQIRALACFHALGIVRIKRRTCHPLSPKFNVDSLARSRRCEIFSCQTSPLRRARNNYALNIAFGGEGVLKESEHAYEIKNVAKFLPSPVVFSGVEYLKLRLAILFQKSCILATSGSSVKGRLKT